MPRLRKKTNQGWGGILIPVVKHWSGGWWWTCFDEKVAMKAGDTPWYLEDKIDDDYIRNVWNKLTVNDMYGRLRDDIRYNQQQTDWDYTLPDNVNGMVVWPYTVNNWDTITIWVNSILKVL